MIEGIHKRPLRWFFMGLLCVALSAPPALALGPPKAPPDPPRQVFDLLVLRPLGLVQTVAGAAFFAVFYPVSLVTGGSDHVVDYCIKSPVEQTFRKPLGDF